MKQTNKEWQHIAPQKQKQKKKKRTAAHKGQIEKKKQNHNKERLCNGHYLK